MFGATATIPTLDASTMPNGIDVAARDPRVRASSLPASAVAAAEPPPLTPVSFSSQTPAQDTISKPIGAPARDARPPQRSPALGRRIAGDVRASLPDSLSCCPVPLESCQFLLISLFAGMGGAEQMWYESAFSPEKMGARSYGLAFESDPHCRTLLQNNFRSEAWGLSSATDSQGVKGSVLALFEEDAALMRTILEAAKDLKLVVIMAGPPCQDFYAAGEQNEFTGSRAPLTVHTAAAIARMKALLKEIRPLAELVYGVENVASMSETCRQSISRMLGVSPVTCCPSRSGGATSRPRLVWANFRWVPPEEVFHSSMKRKVLHKDWVPLADWGADAFSIGCHEPWPCFLTS